MSHILIVEDNEGFRKVIRDRITKQLGHSCEEAGSYTTARGLLHDRFYNVVISDISIPGQNGFELLAHIKSTSPETEVIMISAIDDRETRSGTLTLGASAFLAKPFKLTELDEAIEQALSKQRANAA